MFEFNQHYILDIDNYDRALLHERPIHIQLSKFYLIYFLG